MKTGKLFKPIILSSFVACWLGFGATSAPAAPDVTVGQEATATIVAEIAIAFDSEFINLDFGAIIKPTDGAQTFPVGTDGLRDAIGGTGTGASTGGGQQAGQVTVSGTVDASFQLSTSSLPVNCSDANVRLISVNAETSAGGSGATLPSTFAIGGGVQEMFIGGVLNVTSTAIDGEKTCSYDLTAAYN